jgi:mannose-6-phosphate isomerase-like protein (cupin superfamily)
MIRTLMSALLVASLLEVVAAQRPSSPEGHTFVQPDAIKWGAMGPGGLATAVVDGDPTKAGPFTMMLKLRDGGWIQPHFHNVDKRLVVIQGELLMGHGDAVDERATTPLKAGGVAVMPAGQHHYEGGRGETIVALIANGPFTTTMVKK